MSKINRPAAPDIAKGEGEQAAMSLKMSRLNFDTLIIQYNGAIRKGWWPAAAGFFVTDRGGIAYYSKWI